MGQVNVNPPDDGDRTSAATINLVTVLIVLAVLVFLAWFLFAGPLHGALFGGNTTINVNPPAPSINVNPPAQPQAPNAQPQAPQPPAPQPPANQP